MFQFTCILAGRRPGGGKKPDRDGEDGEDKPDRPRPSGKPDGPRPSGKPDRPRQVVNPTDLVQAVNHPASPTMTKNLSCVDYSVS